MALMHGFRQFIWQLVFFLIQAVNANHLLLSLAVYSHKALLLNSKHKGMDPLLPSRPHSK